MNIAKQIARKVVFPTIVGVGAEKWIRNFSQHNLLNLYYHGVVRKDSTYFNPRHITATQFEKQLAYFKKNFDIISLSDAFQLYQDGKKLSTKTVTVSFDDGFLNNLEVALPLLEKYQVKATIFISSILLEDSNHLLWADLLNAVRFFAPSEVVEINDYKFQKINRFDLYDPEKQVDLANMIKHLSAKDRDMLLEELMNRFQIKDRLKELPSEVWQLMNLEELRKLEASPMIEIGSHSHLHYNLDFIDVKDAIEDMQVSKKLLEDALQKEMYSIAYPDGSYNESIKTEAEKIGFSQQLAVGYRNQGDQADKRILNRYGISNTTTLESNLFFINNSFRSLGYC